MAKKFGRGTFRKLHSCTAVPGWNVRSRQLRAYSRYTSFAFCCLRLKSKMSPCIYHSTSAAEDELLCSKLGLQQHLCLMYSTVQYNTVQHSAVHRCGHQQKWRLIIMQQSISISTLAVAVCIINQTYSSLWTHFLIILLPIVEVGAGWRF